MEPHDGGTVEPEYGEQFQSKQKRKSLVGLSITGVKEMWEKKTSKTTTSSGMSKLQRQQHRAPSLLDQGLGRSMTGAAASSAAAFCDTAAAAPAASSPASAASGASLPPPTPTAPLFALRPAAADSSSPFREQSLYVLPDQLPAHLPGSFGEASPEPKSGKSPKPASLLKKLSSSFRKAVTPKSGSKHQRSDSTCSGGGDAGLLSASPSQGLGVRGHSTMSSDPSTASMDLVMRTDQTPKSPAVSVSQEAHTAEEDQDWAGFGVRSRDGSPEVQSVLKLRPSDALSMSPANSAAEGLAARLAQASPPPASPPPAIVVASPETSYTSAATPTPTAAAGAAPAAPEEILTSPLASPSSGGLRAGAAAGWSRQSPSGVTSPAANEPAIFGLTPIKAAYEHAEVAAEPIACDAAPDVGSAAAAADEDMHMDAEVCSAPGAIEVAAAAEPLLSSVDVPMEQELSWSEQPDEQDALVADAPLPEAEATGPAAEGQAAAAPAEAEAQPPDAAMAEEEDGTCLPLGDAVAQPAEIAVPVTTPPAGLEGEAPAPDALTGAGACDEVATAPTAAAACSSPAAADGKVGLEAAGDSETFELDMDMMDAQQPSSPPLAEQLEPADATPAMAAPSGSAEDVSEATAVDMALEVAAAAAVEAGEQLAAASVQEEVEAAAEAPVDVELADPAGEHYQALLPAGVEAAEQMQPVEVDASEADRECSEAPHSPGMADAAGLLLAEEASQAAADSSAVELAVEGLATIDGVVDEPEATAEAKAAIAFAAAATEAPCAAAEAIVEQPVDVCMSADEDMQDAEPAEAPEGSSGNAPEATGQQPAEPEGDQQPGLLELEAKDAEQLPGGELSVPEPEAGEAAAEEQQLVAAAPDVLAACELEAAVAAAEGEPAAEDAAAEAVSEPEAAPAQQLLQELLLEEYDALDVGTLELLQDDDPMELDDDLPEAGQGNSQAGQADNSAAAAAVEAEADATGPRQQQQQQEEVGGSLVVGGEPLADDAAGVAPAAAEPAQVAQEQQQEVPALQADLPSEDEAAAAAPAIAFEAAVAVTAVAEQEEEAATGAVDAAAADSQQACDVPMDEDVPMAPAGSEDGSYTLQLEPEDEAAAAAVWAAAPDAQPTPAEAVDAQPDMSTVEETAEQEVAVPAAVEPEQEAVAGPAFEAPFPGSPARPQQADDAPADDGDGGYDPMMISPAPTRLAAPPAHSALASEDVPVLRAPLLLPSGLEPLLDSSPERAPAAAAASSTPTRTVPSVARSMAASIDTPISPETAHIGVRAFQLTDLEDVEQEDGQEAALPFQQQQQLVLPADSLEALEADLGLGLLDLNDDDGELGLPLPMPLEAASSPVGTKPHHPDTCDDDVDASAPVPQPQSGGVTLPASANKHLDRNLHVMRDSIPLFTMRDSCQVSESLQMQSLEGLEPFTGKARLTHFQPMATLEELEAEGGLLGGGASGLGSAPGSASGARAGASSPFMPSPMAGMADGSPGLGFSGAMEGGLGSPMAVAPASAFSMSPVLRVMHTPAAMSTPTLTGTRPAAAGRNSPPFMAAVTPKVLPAKPGAVPAAAPGGVTPAASLKTLAAANAVGSGGNSGNTSSATKTPVQKKGIPMFGRSKPLAAPTSGGKLPSAAASTPPGKVSSPPLAGAHAGPAPAATPAAAFKAAAVPVPTASGVQPSPLLVRPAGPAPLPVTPDAGLNLFNTPAVQRAAAMPLADSPFGDFDLDTVDISAEAFNVFAMLNNNDANPAASAAASRATPPPVASSAMEAAGGGGGGVSPSAQILQIQVQMMTTKLVDAQQALVGAQEESAALREQLAEVQFEYSQTQEVMTMENDARKYLEQQAEEGRACIARLENELRHAQARQQQAEQQGDVLQARITDQARAFEQEKVQLHALLQQLQADAEAVMVQAAAADARGRAAEEELGSWKAKHAEAVQQAKDLQGTLGQQAHELALMRRAKEDSDVKFTKAMDQLIDAQTTHKKQMTEADAKMAQANLVLQQVADVRERYRAVKQQAADSERRAQEAERRIADAEARAQDAARRAQESAEALGREKQEKAEVMNMCSLLLTQVEAKK